jgi:DNA polymerase-3 subunit delta'
MPLRDVIGHRRLVGLLSRSIQRGTLPPSLILAGPSGVGKRLVAIAAAQTLNCLSPINPASDPTRQSNQDVPFDACGECAACLRIARGVHADVIVVEPGDTGSIKIEPIRDIVDRANYRPFEGRIRVVIVDEADALVSAAQNALLKTLEEPPSASVFLLITAHPDMLLATVRSRCPRLRFLPLSPAEIAAALMARGCGETEARAVGATADGSIGQALAASAGDLVDARDVAMRVLSHTGGRDHRRAPSVESAKDLLAKTGAGGASDREQLATHLRAMSSILRDVALLGSGAEGQMLANADVRPAVERLSAYRGERGINAFLAVDRALAALDRNAGVKIVADWLVLNL